ncbi:RagB/SusD family nutrient uptake outer membrane protein [uncultured Dokdonia sp.]|uniref:RagB/SusD family nutrient uptake outer membrane protein n=1 Tax=uncultured Dokdonia sp. TaxID=575653 RepID=UPI002628B5CC|nr:RagB/SusD family nutrient uptake outer membrane protein [uncultured Dokdonia sp.]
MNIRFFIFLTSTFFVLACSEDSLKVPVRNDIATENFFLTEEDANAAVIGAYDALQPDSYYGFDYYVLGDVRADNSFAGGDNPNNFSIDNYTLRPTNEVTTRFFRQVYRAIGRANAAIDGITSMDESVFQEGRQNELLGESLFLRALNYFNLVQFYGGVPIVTEATTSLEADQIFIPRNTETEVYEQIINDLRQSIDFLDNQNLEQGRANIGAAETLLAKVQLSLGNFTEVINITNNTMSRGFSLVSDFDTLFDQQNNDNSEVLFAIQYAGAQEGNVFPELILPTPEASFDFIKFNTPTPNSEMAFENNDVRKASSLVERNGILFVFKWRNGNAFNSADNSIVLRYADVLLMRAEALNQMQDNNGAVNLLNEVRNRAGLSNYNGTMTTQAINEAILNERRVEFMFEGQRLFDLKRQGFEATRQAIIQSKNIEIQEFQLLLPIPQGELDRNPELTQNPGY